MTRVILALMMLMAGAIAMPQQEIQDSNDTPVGGRIVGDIVAGILETVSKQIKDAGLDPYTLEQFALAYQLPVPVLFSISTLLEDVVVSGASDIVVNNIDYGLLNGRLRLDISMPELAVSIGSAKVDSVVLRSDMNANGNGRLAIIEPRLFGDMRITLGFSGINVREVNLEFELGAIQFEGNVNVLGIDLTDFVTDLLNNRIPAAIKDCKAEISEMIEIVVRLVISQIL